MDHCCGPGREHLTRAVSPDEAPRDAAAVRALVADGSVAPGDPPADLVDIPAGRFTMGSESPVAVAADGEGPARVVETSAYRIAATAVTTAQFAEFVEATGFVTEAETFGWSFVVADLIGDEAAQDVIQGVVPGAPWWRGVRGASWHSPAGPGSTTDGVADHPVVHVSWNDAVAYTVWRGVRLPTEAEWERASRGGLEGATYPWGDDLTPGGRHRTNIWQGTFPTHNAAEDGYVATAPVDAYSPNGFGLWNTSGNTWEWTADWFSPDWHVDNRPATRHDPQGPASGTARVVRGGSYLCHASFCHRYRVSARTGTTPDSSLGHTGFRVAADPLKP